MKVSQMSMFLFLAFFLLPLFACGNADFHDGVRYQQEGEYDKAISCYKKSIKSERNIALAEKNLGDIYLVKNDYTRGFECYISAIEANPNLVMGYVLKFISDSNKPLRRTAIDYLPKVKNEEARTNMISRLSVMLKSDKLHEKIDALELIANMGNAVEPIFGDVAALLKDENPVVRQKTLSVMPRLEDCVVKFDGVNDIINVVNTEQNELVKIAAIDCLANLGFNARASLPVLFDIAEGDNTFSQNSLKAIDKIAKTDRIRAKDLKKYLTSPKDIIKIKVLNVFGNMSSEASDIVAYIIPMLKDYNAEIRELARATLRKIGVSSKESVADLEVLLNHRESEIRLMALTELADLGKDASSALPAVEKLLKDPNENVRKYAEYAISNINK